MNKLSKWNDCNMGLVGRGVVANYGFMGTFKFYCITSSPKINGTTNDLDSLTMTYCKRKVFDPAWGDLTRPTRLGGSGFIKPSMKVVALHI